MTGRTRHAIDLALVAWVAACVILGVSVAARVDDVSRLSDTVTAVGGAVDAAGSALDSLSSVPFVGDRLKEPARRVRAAGQSALASGRSSRSSIHDLSTLLGWALALIPTVPLIALYLPFRLGHLRVVRVERV